MTKYKQPKLDALHFNVIWLAGWIGGVVLCNLDNLILQIVTAIIAVGIYAMFIDYYFVNVEVQK